MCGLAGFVNVALDKQTALIAALAEGIDRRGKDAAGYISTHASRGPNHAKRLGTFMGKTGASKRFMRQIPGDAVILHARFATCGNKTVNEAHPYAIRRDGKSVLWGAHNGIVSGTQESAKAHSRGWETDSREVFELLADGKVENIAKMSGYGTLAWILNADRSRIRVVAMNSSADLEVCYTDCGACVFASTRTILEAGLKAAGMTHGAQGSGYLQIRVGQILELRAEDGKAYPIEAPRVTVSSYVKSYSGNRYTGYGADWDNSAFEGWEGSAAYSYYSERGFSSYGYGKRGNANDATRRARIAGNPAVNLMGSSFAAKGDPFEVKDTLAPFSKRDGIWQRDTDGKPMGDDTEPTLPDTDERECPTCGTLDTSLMIGDPKRGNFRQCHNARCNDWWVVDEYGNAAFEGSNASTDDIDDPEQADESSLCPKCGEETDTLILQGLAYMCDYCGHIFGVEDRISAPELADDSEPDTGDPPASEPSVIVDTGEATGALGSDIPDAVTLAERVIDDLPADGSAWTRDDWEAFEEASEVIRLDIETKAEAERKRTITMVPPAPESQTA
jgi:predicted RNA-binding Zn-ribbon protein involved in translation (DUF1610 family)